FGRARGGPGLPRVARTDCPRAPTLAMIAATCRGSGSSTTSTAGRTTATPGVSRDGDKARAHVTARHSPADAARGYADPLQQTRARSRPSCAAMNRRAFLGGVLGFLAGPPGAGAQSTEPVDRPVDGKVWRIGIVRPGLPL